MFTGSEAPNRVWTGDITYIRTGQDWLYRQSLKGGRQQEWVQVSTLRAGEDCPE